MPVTIDGLSDLNDMLMTVAPRTAKRWLTQAADPAAQVVEDAMRQTAPIGESGTLAGSPMHANDFSNEGASTKLTVRIGPDKDAYWGLFQEFGTKESEGFSKRKSHRHFHHTAQPAQHWMQRAWEATKEKCLSVFATELLARLADMEAKK